MKLIHTHDGRHYRRWINVVPTYFLPGSAQFLAGKKTLGVLLYVSYLLLEWVYGGLCVHPGTSLSLLSLMRVLFLFHLTIAIDGFRRPIPCLHAQGWALLFCFWLGVDFLPVFGIRQFVVQPYQMPSHSMEPMLMGNRKDADGHPIMCDRIWVNKLIYHVAEPQRGDLVVFETKDIQASFAKKDKCYVQRLVGLPGETIRLEPPHVVVNGHPLTKPVIFSMISMKKHGFEGYSFHPRCTFLKSTEDQITLGPDEYFVLADNSKAGVDSRSFGPIKRSSIIGKAFYIYAPTERKGWIE